MSLEAKVTDLEYRSMRDNLMFYGIPEQQNEDCKVSIKQFMNVVLEIPQADKLTFDRVHWVGAPAHGKVRPIVAKFHYFKEREAVRSKSFELSDKLKAENVGVGAQWPKKMRETRKNLYDIMKQEKAKGNTVKLMKDKLYLDGHLYQPGSTLAAKPTPAAATGP